VRIIEIYRRDKNEVARKQSVSECKGLPPLEWFDQSDNIFNGHQPHRCGAESFAAVRKLDRLVHLFDSYFSHWDVCVSERC